MEPPSLPARGAGVCRSRRPGRPLTALVSLQSRDTGWSPSPGGSTGGSQSRHCRMSGLSGQDKRVATVTAFACARRAEHETGPGHQPTRPELREADSGRQRVGTTRFARRSTGQDVRSPGVDGAAVDLQPSRRPADGTAVTSPDHHRSNRGPVICTSMESLGRESTARVEGEGGATSRTVCRRASLGDRSCRPHLGCRRVRQG